MNITTSSKNKKLTTKEVIDQGIRSRTAMDICKNKGCYNKRRLHSAYCGKCNI